MSDEANSEYKSLADVVGMDDDRLARMNEAAWRLYNERRYREAAAVFRGLTVLDPEAVEFYRGLSLAAVKDNDLLAASEALEAACALLAYRNDRKAERGQLLAMLSAVLYRSGRRREALDRADEALELAPAGAPWVEPLKQGAKKASDILLKTGGLKAPTDTSELKRILRARLAEVGKGQQTLARALGYGDRDLMKVYENGAALLDAGEPVRASRIFEGLVELDGGVPLFRLALATAREVFGDHKSAAIAYDEAVEAARVVPGGVDLLADALLRRARHRFKRGKRTAVREDLAAVDALPESALNDDLQSLKKSIEVALAGGVLQGSADPPPPDRPKHRKKKRKPGGSGLVGKSPTKPENPNG